MFGVGAAGSVLGIALLSASEPLIPTYEHQLGFDDALADQRTAAAMMWIGGMATTVPLLLVAVWRWASAEERNARRAESLAFPVRSGGTETRPGGRERSGGERGEQIDSVTVGVVQRRPTLTPERIERLEMSLVSGIDEVLVGGVHLVGISTGEGDRRA